MDRCVTGLCHSQPEGASSHCFVRCKQQRCRRPSLAEAISRIELQTPGALRQIEADRFSLRVEQQQGALASALQLQHQSQTLRRVPSRSAHGLAVSRQPKRRWALV